MDQAIDRTGTEACAKRTLGSIALTGVLLMSAVLATVLAVDLPFSAADGTTQHYVPASHKWIELGAEKVSDPLGLTPERQRRS